MGYLNFIVLILLMTGIGQCVFVIKLILPITMQQGERILGCMRNCIRYGLGQEHALPRCSIEGWWPGQLQGSGYSDQEPDFLSPLENLTVTIGRDVHFTCTVNNLGIYKVAWIKSDTKRILAIHTHMVSLNSRLSVSHNGHNTWKLYISNVEPEDSGTYMCQINTVPMMSQMGYLDVVIPADIADDDGSEASAPEGGSVELRCTATGVPEPTVYWKRSEGHITFRNETGKEIKVVERYDGTVLSLKGLQRTDMGAYLCIAYNGIPPKKSRRYEVSVLFKPLVRVGTPVVMKAMDMQVTLNCFVESSPKSLMSWEKGKSQALNYLDFGGKLLNSSKYIISEETVNTYSLRMNLTITRLKKSDFGDYTCSAANAHGRAESYITLKETPIKTTTSTTTTTTTTTTPPPTTTLATTTRVPKRHLKKQLDRTMQNLLNGDIRQTELNNALNFYNVNAHGTTNNTHNEYAQRTERQKIRPSGPPRHYVVYNNKAKCIVPFVTLFVANLIVNVV